MGVAAAAIIDADALTGRELPTVLEAACMPKRLREAVLQTRTDLRNAIAQRCGVEPRSVKLKRDVIDGLTRREREEFEDIRSHCARYGVFVVPVGELEDWLRALDLPSAKDKARWFRRALKGLGRDPTEEGYVWPATDDIWGFVRGIVRWVRDPGRAGTRPRP